MGVGSVLEKDLMFYKFRIAVFLYYALGAIVIFGMGTGCSPKHYKAEADEEVYKIIDGKWQEDFGEKVNYTVSDVTPSANDIQIEKAVPASGTISLAQAVSISTAKKR